MDDDFMGHIPEHRAYINQLIDKGIIDQYVVSMESQRVWITFSAASKQKVKEMLERSPIFHYWTYEIDELFVVDGLQYRLPVVRLN
jgi:muconolactone delta-isomerase